MIATIRAKTNSSADMGMSYIRGESREQVYLFPEAIDDYVQIAVDEKHKLIVAHDATNASVLPVRRDGGCLPLPGR